MPDTCQWFQPESKKGAQDQRDCLRDSASTVEVQLTLGMHATVHLCAQHKAELNRRNAELRLGRGKR